MAATISTAAPSSVISSKTARTRSANTKSRVVTPQKRNQGLINKQQARHFVKWGTSVLNTIDDGGVESEIDESEIYQSEDTEREDDKSGSVLHSRAVQLLEDIHPGKEKFAESSCELGNILTDPQFPSKYHGTEKASVLKVATEVLGGCKASAKDFDTTAGLLTASAGESAKSCPSNLLPRSTSVTPKSEERGNQEMSDMLSRMSSIRSLDKESKSELRDDLKRFHSSILKHTPDSVESGKLLADLTAINCHRLKDIERSKSESRTLSKMAWLNATRLSEYLSSHRELVAQELSKASQGSISQSLANLGQTNDLGTKVDCNKSSEDESTPVSTEAPEPTEA